MSKLLSVDHGTQKGSQWLKAFLVLDACIKGVQSFVGIAMQRLHDKVVAIVKENVKDDMGECADGDWDCSFCKPLLLLCASCFDSNTHHCHPFRVTRCCLKDTIFWYRFAARSCGWITVHSHRCLKF